jgi:hypothetical protein
VMLALCLSICLGTLNTVMSATFQQVWRSRDHESETANGQKIPYSKGAYICKYAWHTMLAYH